jgi:hypothetical protein
MAHAVGIGAVNKLIALYDAGDFKTITRADIFHTRWHDTAILARVAIDEHAVARGRILALCDVPLLHGFFQVGLCLGHFFGVGHARSSFRRWFNGGVYNFFVQKMCDNFVKVL